LQPSRKLEAVGFHFYLTNIGRYIFMAKAKAATGLNKLLNISDELAEIIGKKKASRPMVMKLVWAYIKKYDLQDPDSRRTIIPDDLLAEVLGSKPIDMMKMTKKLSDHMS
jgi:chromatin remodeling complex protein RSC6